MSTAARVITIVKGASVVTLASGYCLTYSGTRRLFECAHIHAERRNKSGRTTSCIATYKDGSAIKYTWSQSSGPRYKEI